MRTKSVSTTGRQDTPERKVKRKRRGGGKENGGVEVKKGGESMSTVLAKTLHTKAEKKKEGKRIEREIEEKKKRGRRFKRRTRGGEGSRATKPRPHSLKRCPLTGL